jgi:hypothetical protein
MIVTYGSFPFLDNEAMVSFWGQQLQIDSRGRARMRKQRVAIEGEIIADGAAAIDARVAAIQDAFSLGGQSMSLLIPPSTATHISLDNTTSLSGVRVMQVSFPQQDGMAHYATGLPFFIVLEADYLLSPGDELTSYTETITYIGNGGPRKVVVELIEGPPAIQYTTEQTPITVIQSGEAVGILSQPNVNPPILPNNLLDVPDGIQYSAGTPRMDNGIYVDFPIRWEYRMTVPIASMTAADLPFQPSPALRDVA